MENIEKIARALFEKENRDPSVVWGDAFTSRAEAGKTVIAGVGEEVRERYRARAINGERP